MGPLAIGLTIGFTAAGGALGAVYCLAAAFAGAFMQAKSPSLGKSVFGGAFMGAALGLGIGYGAETLMAPADATKSVDAATQCDARRLNGENVAVVQLENGRAACLPVLNP